MYKNTATRHEVVQTSTGQRETGGNGKDETEVEQSAAGAHEMGEGQDIKLKQETRVTDFKIKVEALI